MNFQPHFLFDEFGKPIAGKPLILGLSNTLDWQQSGWGEHEQAPRAVYLYLGLEPTTDADYYQYGKGIILLPQSAGKELIDQHYKVNVNRLYCMEQAELEALIDVEKHSLIDTPEINPRNKVWLENLMAMKHQWNNPFKIKGFLDELDTLCEYGDPHYCEPCQKVCALRERTTLLKRTDNVATRNLFYLKFNEEAQNIKLDLIYDLGEKKLFLNGPEASKRVKIAGIPFYPEYLTEHWNHYYDHLKAVKASLFPDNNFEKFFLKTRNNLGAMLEAGSHIREQLARKELVCEKKPEEKEWWEKENETELINDDDDER